MVTDPCYLIPPELFQIALGLVCAHQYQVLLISDLQMRVVHQSAKNSCPCPLRIRLQDIINLDSISASRLCYN